MIKDSQDPREKQGDAHETRIRELNDARRQNIAPPEPDELDQAGSRAKDIREVDTTQYDESNAGEGPD